MLGESAEREEKEGADVQEEVEERADAEGGERVGGKEGEERAEQEEETEERTSAEQRVHGGGAALQHLRNIFSGETGLAKLAEAAALPPPEEETRERADEEGEARKAMSRVREWPRRGNRPPLLHQTRMPGALRLAADPAGAVLLQEEPTKEPGKGGVAVLAVLCLCLFVGCRLKFRDCFANQLVEGVHDALHR